MKKRIYIALLLSAMMPAMAGNALASSTGEVLFEPDAYGITIYEIGLFRSNPTRDPIDFSDAVVVYENSSGEDITVVDGAPTILSGTINRPPNGTYTHGYVIMKPEIRLTAKYTTGVTTYFTKGTDLSISGFGSGLRNDSSLADYLAGSDVDDYGETVWTMDGLGLSATYPVFEGEITGGNVYLTAGDYSIATPSSAVTSACRIVGIIDFGSVTIDDSVTGVDYKFKVTEGAVFQPLDQTGTNYAIYPGEIKLDARLLN